MPCGYLVHGRVPGSITYTILWAKKGRTITYGLPSMSRGRRDNCSAGGLHRCPPGLGDGGKRYKSLSQGQCRSWAGLAESQQEILCHPGRPPTHISPLSQQAWRMTRMGRLRQVQERARWSLFVQPPERSLTVIGASQTTLQTSHLRQHRLPEGSGIFPAINCGRVTKVGLRTYKI